MNPEHYIYTLHSTDPEHYNELSVRIEPPATEMAIFQITQLTAKCSILILTTDDYFVINSNKYNFLMDYSDLNTESFCEIVDDLIANDGYYCECDTASRIHLFAQNEFELSDASYNTKLLLGLHDIELPLISKYNDKIETDQKHEIQIDSVGYTLSTPVLYLLCNVGSKAFQNDNCLKVAMSITNSFSANYPIVAGNSDYQTIVRSNDLTNLEFKLVDANLKNLKLLAPMYITIVIEGLQDPDHNIYKLLIEQQQMQMQMQMQK